MSDTLVETPEEQPLPQPKLSKADRCDVGGCPAQALVMVEFKDGDLIFCSHHFNKLEASLFESAEDIHDERYQLSASA
jgi:hypothetical protein